MVDPSFRWSTLMSSGSASRLKGRRRLPNCGKPFVVIRDAIPVAWLLSWCPATGASYVDASCNPRILSLVVSRCDAFTSVPIPRKSSVFDDNRLSSSGPSIPVLDHTSLQHPQSSLVLDIVAFAPIQISRIAGSAAFVLQFSSRFRET